MPPHLWIAAGLIALVPFSAMAESATIAVASNFATTAEQLAASYMAASGNDLSIVSGASGKLFAQITTGAPFDAFLSADQKTPLRLVEAGLGLPDSRFTYARGVLAVWTVQQDADLSDPKAALLVARHVAIANPDLAPYGKAAKETIESLGISDAIAGQIVTGENIGQAQTMVASGAADLGFVAAPGTSSRAGRYWIVPEAMHSPLLQDAVLLSHGKDNAAATGFLAYLRSPAARAAIADAGYVAP
jgi:molybdate transport system substrate-binding protein